MSIQKPFLKWVGGKTQILEKIIAKIPNEMNNYHELFLGGGSVLFAILTLKKQGIIKIHGKIYGYDINKDLINVYKNIQNNKDTFFEHLEIFKNTYHNLKGNIINRNPQCLEEGLTSKESYYYYLRNRYNTINKESIECSALFMFLNKTGFRGMYREGPKGFNIPYGHHKKTPSMITKEELNSISELIQNVIFIHSDYNVSFEKLNEGDFIYLDPPYAPENDKSFVGYTKDGFSYENHVDLFEKIKQLNEKKVKFILSNAKVALVEDYFKDYTIEHIEARRAINSKNPGSKTMEVLIIN